MEEYIYFLKSRARDVKNKTTDRIVVAAKSKAYLKEYAELFNREAEEFGLHEEYFVDTLRIDQAMVDTYLGAYRDRYLSKAYYDRYSEKKDMYFGAFIKASNNKYSEFCEKLCQNPDMEKEPVINQEAIDSLDNKLADDEVYYSYKMGDYQIFLYIIDEEIILDMWKLNANPKASEGNRDKHVVIKKFNTYFQAHEYILNNYFRTSYDNGSITYKIGEYIVDVIKMNRCLGGHKVYIQTDDNEYSINCNSLEFAYLQIFRLFSAD